jgi:hypothetical protein|uniref:Tail tape measure n=1 Tax=Myoviridae sp. ctXwe21 TaxID=2825123 RepID=A0A8S5PZF5_9CAUD|nr:MAG TPA: tail tape measure [Myoviridae sp. ctXwe21]
MADLGNLNFGVHLKDYTEQEYEAIKKKLVNMHATTSAKVGLKVDIKEIEDKVEALLKNKTYKVKLDVDSESIKKLKEAFKGQGIDTSELRAMRGVSQIIRADAYASSQKALEQLRIARMQAAKASDTHNAAMKRTNATMSSQSRIAGGLKNQIANVYSIYTLERFVRGLYTIGGEFQKQRIALTSIIGDSMKAETIFNRIKDLAVVSPFQFKELASYAKQLSAYSIPYEELYDTTKRLADISAGVGVDMGRIILAYGQVRSAAFLRGQELRQFTEAGIPLVDELAKRFTKLTGVVTSAGDVFDKISRKEVSFGMVKDVLWELTDEGGKFYNMQEALAESLAGKWSNLQDAWDVMMADIAESNSGVLSDSLEILTKLMKHWEAVAAILGALVGAYGFYKAAVIAVNAAHKATITINTITNIINMTRAMQGLTAVTKAQAVAQGILNAVSSVNPWMVLITTIGALAGLYFTLREKTKSAAETIREFNVQVQEQNEKISEAKNKANGYISTMFNTSKAVDARRMAYERLQEIYPSIFKSMSYEQALLKGQIELLNMSNRAARTTARETARINLERAYQGLFEAERGVKYAELFSVASDGHIMDTKMLKEAKAQLGIARSIVKEAKEDFLTILSATDDIDKNTKSAWFTTAKEIAGDMNSLIPKDDEAYEEYAKRIKEERENADKILKGFKKGNPYSEDTIRNAQKVFDVSKKIMDTLGVLGKSTENTKDPIAEQWKARTDLIDKAVSSYEKWRKIEGDEAATQRVKGISEFSSVFEEKGVNLDLNNPSKAYKYIQGQLDRSKEKQEDLYISLGVKIDKAGIDNAKQEVDNALKEIERYISESGKKWDLYKQLFDITGSREQSMSIAFGGEIGFDSLIDELKAKLRKKTGAYSDMPVDIVLGLDEKAIREKFGKSANEILSLQKEINDKIQEKNDFSLIDEQKTIMEFASIEKKIEAVKGKYQELIDSATTQEGKEAYTQKMNKEIQELNDESIKLLPLWQKLFGDTTNMGYNNLRRLVNEAKKFSESAIEQKDPITGKSQFELTDNDNKKHILSLEEYLRLLKQIEKTQNELNSQNPFQGVIDGFQKLKAAEGEEEKQDALKVIGSNANAAAQMIQGVTEAWANMFSAFGNDDLADTLGLVGELTGELGSLVEGLTSGNPVQMASSALSFIPNIIGSIAKAHDKKLDKAIQRSQLEVKKLSNDYKNLQSVIERQLGAVTQSQSKEMIANLQKQQEEVQKQMEAEQDKKDSDASKIEDYKQQYIELGEQIKYFYEDLASEQFGIDLKGWSDQISEALVNAFANGEDAAKAFDDTVADIMRNVIKEMISLNVIQPAMNKLKDYLFGDKGIFTDNSAGGTNLTEQEAAGLMQQLGSLRGTISDSKKIWDYLNAAAKKMGISLEETSASNTLSKGIQENITEETANILASYINGIRADVSVKRALLEKWGNEILPKYNVIAEQQLTQLRAIANNTLRSAQNTEANVALVQEVRDMLNIVIDRGGRKIKI